MSSAAKKLSAVVGNAEHEVVVEPLEPAEPGQDGRFRVVLRGVEKIVDARRVDTGTWSLLLDGRQWIVDVDVAKDGALWVDVGGVGQAVKLVDPRRRALSQTAQRPRAASGPEAVRAPMPGKVVKVLCAAGDPVAAGQGLVVVEAMKMENELRAPRDGVVKAVQVKEGQAVEALQTLVTLE